MGKGALLLVFGASVVFTVMNLQLNKSAEQANSNLVRYYERSVAGEIADQAAEYLLTRLADSSRWRTPTAMLDQDVIGVDGDYSVFYSVKEILKPMGGIEKEMLELHITVRYGRETDTVIVYMSRQFGFVPAIVRGVFTSSGSLSRTFGEMTIDGRNHDPNGKLDSSEPGVFGLSSAKGFHNSGKDSSADAETTNKTMFPDIPRITMLSKRTLIGVERSLTPLMRYWVIPREL